MNEEQKKQLVELVKQAMEKVSESKTIIVAIDDSDKFYYIYDNLSRAYISLMLASDDLKKV